MIRPVCLMAAPCPGPVTRRGSVSSRVGPVRGPSLTAAEWRARGRLRTWDSVEDENRIPEPGWLCFPGIQVLTT